MGIVKTILLVAFIIVCLFLILFVLIQPEDNNGMGSSFGGGNSAAFGARTQTVLSKTTGLFVFLFFVLTFSIAFLNRPEKKQDLSATVKEMNAEETSAEAKSGNWMEAEINAAEPSAEAAVTPAESAAE